MPVYIVSENLRVGGCFLYAFLKTIAFDFEVLMRCARELTIFEFLQVFLGDALTFCGEYLVVGLGWRHRPQRDRCRPVE
ncbi:hypothetical protein TNCV_2921641, partial [Trichonephila clavipes]